MRCLAKTFNYWIILSHSFQFQSLHSSEKISVLTLSFNLSSVKWKYISKLNSKCFVNIKKDIKIHLGAECYLPSFQFSTFLSLSRVQLFVTPWTAAHQASLSIINSRSLLKHAHLVSDAIQPSHLLLSHSPPAIYLSQHQGIFKWVSSSHQVAKVLEFQLQHQSFQWIFRTDFL